MEEKNTKIEDLGKYFSTENEISWHEACKEDYKKLHLKDIEGLLKDSYAKSEKRKFKLWTGKGGAEGMLEALGYSKEEIEKMNIPEGCYVIDSDADNFIQYQG